MDLLKKTFSWLNYQPPPRKPQHCRLWPPKLPRTKGTWSNKQSDGVAEETGCKYSFIGRWTFKWFATFCSEEQECSFDNASNVYSVTWSESNNGLYIRVVHFSNIFILCFLKNVFSMVLCYRSDFFVCFTCYDIQ